VQDAKDRAHKESQALIDSARSEIEISKEAALAELKNYLADTSLLIAEKVIRKNLSGDVSQQQLVKDLLVSHTSSN
jgi:F-type H+-transporting ATPase subunit b